MEIDTHINAHSRSCEESILGENKHLDSDTARSLFEVGANLFMLDVPMNTEIGVDMNSWNTGPNFKGIKMIPPGVHFVYWSAVSKEGQTAPRSGFFHNFRTKEVLVKKYNLEQETFEDVHDEETIHRLQSNLKNLDRNLGAYPYDSWKKWVSLSNKISIETIQRLEPTSGVIHSVTELIPQTHRTSNKDSDIQEGMSSMDTGDQTVKQVLLPEEANKPQCSNPSASKKRSLNEDERENQKLPKMECNPNAKIRFTEIPPRFPEGSTPSDITKHSMDSSYQLEQYLSIFKRLYGDAVSNSMSDRSQLDEALGELQYSFICFLVGQNYDAFEKWKQLLRMFCTSDEALAGHTLLYMTLISDLHFQIREVPEDFFVDIVSSNNFLVTLLTTLFSLARDNISIDPKLKARIEKFKKSLSLKFDWDFSEIDDGEEPDEDKPVIVQI